MGKASNRMSWQVRSFQAVKAGSQPEECEDAVACDETAGVFAIADGATDAAFQRLWASLLVESFLQQPPDMTDHADPAEWLSIWLPLVQEQWHATVPWDALPWHGLTKARQVGGLATFLGVQCAAGRKRWRAVAVGDCTLLQVSAAGDLLFSGPLTSAAEFGNTPVALSSISPNVSPLLEHFYCFEGELGEGETLLLITDALAAWVFRELEAGNQPLTRLLLLRDDAHFGALVEELRLQRRMRNDDTTLLTIARQEHCAGPSEAIHEQIEDNHATAAG